MLGCDSCLRLLCRLHLLSPSIVFVKMPRETDASPASLPTQTGAISPELWLAAIVGSSDDAIVSKNLSGIIMSWNPSAEKIFGYSAAEAVGQSITLIIPPER